MSEDWRKVYIYELARKKIQHWPLEVKKDFGAILTKLQKRLSVGYPDTKPIADVGPGVFEIRLGDAGGIYRVFYVVKTEIGILVFHSFQKKTQKTPKQEIETGRMRLKTYLKEFEK